MADHEAKTTGVVLSNSAYDTLRRVVEVIMPALAAFYVTVALIWGLPYVEQVVGTITALTVLMAAVLGLSRKAFKGSEQFSGEYDGEVVVDTTDPDQTFLRLEPYEGKLQEAVNKDRIVFKGLNTP